MPARYGPCTSAMADNMDALYEPRWYRDQLHASELHAYTVSFKETDLWIGVNAGAFTPELERASYDAVRELRTQLDAYITTDPDFLYTLSPHIPKPSCPPVASLMAAAAAKAGVGPMAAVAGAFSQLVAGHLLRSFPITDLIIENGGDIYLISSRTRRIAVYAGNSPLSNKIALEIPADRCPLGICTSSGSVGHSLSFGKADAVTVLCKDALVSDAYATAICNMVKTPADIDDALYYSTTRPDIMGIVIIIGDRIGLRGDVKPVKI